MKTKVLIGLLFTQVFLTTAAQTSTLTDRERQEMLLSLCQRQVLFDDSTPLDSVIAWSERLLPAIKSATDRNTYFQQQLLLADAYTLLGDISLATSRAWTMYEEARKDDFPFGIVLANQAIGNAYSTISNMTDKALESYQDAMNELNNVPAMQSYKTRLLISQSQALQTEARWREAQKVLERLERLSLKGFDYPSTFLFYVEKADFAISMERTEEAKMQIDKMDSIFQSHPEKFFRFYMNFTTAAYFRLLGQKEKDPQQYDRAAYIYSRIREEYSDNKHCMYYRRASLEQIKLCKQLGKPQEACELYQDLYPMPDTVAPQSYIRQINAMKTKYQIDRVETANEREYNRIVKGLLIGSVVILIISLLMAYLLKKQWKKLKLSTQKLKESRVNAENATKAKSVFLSNMSHEIRTPLNALSGFSSLLTEEGLDDETRRQCNEVIQQNSELLLKLINDIIDLSNFEFGKLQLVIEKHDAVYICRNVIDTVNKVKQTQADVFFETDLEEMVIDTDASRLQQLLINLLINATKFTPQGSITLRLVKEPNDMLLFTVTDTGCGIPKEKQANIFQRFEKLNENIQGSGLGLSICQLIIERVGGKIWLDPEYTDGCRFCFTHPINQPAGKEEQPQ